MRDAWFGDRRDVVKWAAVAHIASREQIEMVTHVAFLRRVPPFKLETPDGTEQINPSVWQFFRDITTIRDLGSKLKLEIVVYSEDFKHRSTYTKQLSAKLGEISKRKLVLLDPDTGIAPKQPTLGHVKHEDIRSFWDALRLGDWLVVYQHASRKKDWLGEPRRVLSEVCDGRPVAVYKASKLASDVAFLCVKK